MENSASEIDARPSRCPGETLQSPAGARTAQSLMKSLPTHTFLLVQEIPDETTYNRLTENVRLLKSFPIGTGDKLRLIFSQESETELAKRVFAGLEHNPHAFLVPISTEAAAPN